DQMLLSDNDIIYIKIKKNKRVEAGQLLTLWEEREVKNLADFPLVWVRGIAKVNRVNPKTGMVRARIVESLTEVERGIRVGPMDRQIDVVEPVPNDKNVEARIVGALYPHEFYGQGQVVFIDKGSQHGLKIGNRLFAVSRGDLWRLGLHNAGKLADERAITEDDRHARTEETPDTDEPKLYPAETYAELRVMRVRKKHATCLITGSIREIPRGALVVARKGY
ncbi:MAG TPA: LysM peptidoglycan-binding domain-containing protein, partial [Polyangiaceae bacterium]|nr:LysM peptidoglycan-binding domain-containing protein [Polyangiaceae bacterium]